MSLSEVIKAADFAARKHKDQRRKDPDSTPYINHPIGVANILANEGSYVFSHTVKSLIEPAGSIKIATFLERVKFKGGFN